eukprot:7673517-Ditylum_brightwellii.AAC.1
MKVNHKSLEFANQNIRNKPLPIPFYMSDNKKKLRPLDSQTYKLQNNPKDKKLVVYNLVVKYYKWKPLMSGYSAWKPSHRSSRVRTSRIEIRHTNW